MRFFTALILVGLLSRGAPATEKVLMPEDKCVQNLEKLSRTISGSLESFIYYGKTPGTKKDKKDAGPASSETSESTVKVSVGADVYTYTVKDLYECQVEKLSLTKSE